VLLEGGYREGLTRDLELFRDWTRNRPLAPTDLSDRDYRYVFKREDLRRTIDEIKAKDLHEISIDCEWCGSDYRSGVLRTVQFAWAEKTACVVILANADGQPHLESAGLMQELSQFINGYKPAIIGHALRADGRWLEHRHIHVMRLMSFDTMLADHALNENAEHGLESCSTRYTDMGRYDVPLNKWLDHNGIGQKFIKVHGFRGIPDEVLLPYAACDADCTFRVANVLRARMSLPENEGPRRCFERVILPTNLPINEIEMSGVLVDVDRMETLTHRFAVKKVELLEKLRDYLKMPTFNPRSTPQMQGLLFGKPECGGLGMFPYKTTGKPSKMWADLNDREVMRATPATDMETLEYLSDQNPVCAMLRDFKIVDQITKTFLREAEIDEDTQEEIYTGGLLYELDDDGRIRTTISQMSETGRWKSSRPNCLPDYVEALTDRGWVLWPDVKPDDLLAQRDMQTGEIVFAKPLALYSYELKGELMHLHHQYCNMVSTLDHRYYVQSRFSKKW
jgi:DNA polymerase I-like protein with 3'-5' exonuclease and polymerase domains